MKWLVSLFTILMSLNSFSTELLEITALNNKITLLAPKEFRPMPEKLLSMKYHASRRPTEVFSDATGGVSLAFNHTQNKMDPSQIASAQKSISQAFHNLYPSATWIRDGVVSQNGSEFMVLELVTPAMDTQIHNIIYGTSVDGRFLLIAFNTTVQQAEEWLPIGKKVMESITLTK